MRTRSLWTYFAGIVPTFLQLLIAPSALDCAPTSPDVLVEDASPSDAPISTSFDDRDGSQKRSGSAEAADDATSAPSDSSDSTMDEGHSSFGSDSGIDADGIYPDTRLIESSVGDASASDDGSPTSCPVQRTIASVATVAQSAGFAGTDTAYFALYNVACVTVDTCIAACTAAGGTGGSCALASACETQQSSTMVCLPPTYWRNVATGVSQSDMTTDAAELTLVTIPYRDALVLSGFDIPIPDSATVRGIEVQIRRNADDGFAADEGVNLVEDGMFLGADRRSPAAWPQNLTYATYGGPADTWGALLRPADLRKPTFGVSVAARYTGPVNGNDRAHIDSARATIFYDVPCD